MSHIPIQSTGIAVVLLKKINAVYHVLLVKRSSSKLHNVWCYIGGGIEAEETAVEAAYGKKSSLHCSKGATLPYCPGLSFPV